MVRSERKRERQPQTSTKSEPTTERSRKTCLRYLKMVARPSRALAARSTSEAVGPERRQRPSSDLRRSPAPAKDRPSRATRLLASESTPRGDILALQPVHRSRWTACRRGSAAPPTMVLEENIRVSCISLPALRGGLGWWRVGCLCLGAWTHSLLPPRSCAAVSAEAARGHRAGALGAGLATRRGWRRRQGSRAPAIRGVSPQQLAAVPSAGSVLERVVATLLAIVPLLLLEPTRRPLLSGSPPSAGRRAGGVDGGR